TTTPCSSTLTMRDLRSEGRLPVEVRRMARGRIELPTRGFSVAAVAGTIVACARERARNLACGAAGRDAPAVRFAAARDDEDLSARSRISVVLSLRCRRYARQRWLPNASSVGPGKWLEAPKAE